MGDPHHNKELEEVKREVVTSRSTHQSWARVKEEQYLFRPKAVKQITLHNINIDKHFTVIAVND